MSSIQALRSHKQRAENKRLFFKFFNSLSPATISYLIIIFYKTQANSIFSNALDLLISTDIRKYHGSIYLS